MAVDNNDALLHPHGLHVTAQRLALLQAAHNQILGSPPT
jgi:hypothetical protein